MNVIFIKLLATSLFWGGTFVAGRIVAQQAEPFAASFLRFAFSAVILAIMNGSEKSPLRRLQGKEVLSLLLLGLTGVALYNLFFFLGLQTVPAGRAALIVANNPVFIALCSAVLFGERMGAAGFGGVVLCLAGAVVVIARGDVGALLAGGVGRGEAYIVGCVACWVAYSLMGKQVLQRLSPLFAVTWSCIIGAAFLFLPAAGEGLFTALPTYTVATWVGIVYLALFGTVWGFIWYYEGIQRLGAARAAVFINFVPVWAVLLGWVLLDEPLSWSLVAGGTMVVLGAYLTNRRPASQDAKQ
ncbi:MAG: DMT family transporter [Syntrophales bacterium]|nr:DMT family transporter [Syntrophales bacterium]